MQNEFKTKFVKHVITKPNCKWRLRSAGLQNDKRFFFLSPIFNDAVVLVLLFVWVSIFLSK